MELNRDQIIKSLVCISGEEIMFCRECRYNGVGAFSCRKELAKDALTLIRELTEENEGLNERLNREARCQYDLCGQIVNLRDNVKYIKADTARKIQKFFEECLDISVYGYSTEEVVSDVLETLDGVIKEVLEENNV